MKLAVFASVVTAATAFAPSTSKLVQTSLNSAFENELGVQEPIGFWDPLGTLNKSSGSVLHGENSDTLLHAFDVKNIY